MHNIGPIIKAYSKMDQRFSFEDPIQVYKFLQWIVGYVQDNYLILTFRYAQSHEDAMLEAQDTLI